MKLYIPLVHNTVLRVRQGLKSNWSASIFSGPFTRFRIEFGPSLKKLLGYACAPVARAPDVSFRHRRRATTANNHVARVLEHRIHNLQNFAGIQCGAPIRSQDVNAKLASRSDGGVVDLGGEVHLERLKGVVWRELQNETEYTTLVKAVLRSHNGSGPLEKISGVLGAGGKILRLISKEIIKFLSQPFHSHLLK